MTQQRDVDATADSRLCDSMGLPQALIVFTFAVLSSSCHEATEGLTPCEPGIAAEQILADESGRSLAETVRISAVSPAKAPLAAAYWALVLDAVATGEASPPLLEWNVVASLTSNTTRLAQVTPSCPSTLRQAVISTPPACTDDCLPPLGSAFRSAAGDWLEASLQPSNADLHAEVQSMAERLRGGMAANESQAETERRIREDIAPDRATRFLTRVTRLIGKAALVAKAVELLGVTVGAAAIAEVAATLAAITLAAKTVKLTVVLVSEYRSCKTWKAANCSRDGGDDAGLETDAGVLDGGPTELDGGPSRDGGRADAGPSDAGFAVCDAGGREFFPLNVGASWTYSVVGSMSTYRFVLRVSAPGRLSYAVDSCSNPSACPHSGDLTSSYVLTSQGLESRPGVGPSPVVFAFPQPPGYRWTCWPFDFHGLANAPNQYLEVVSNDETVTVAGRSYCAVRYRAPSGEVWVSPGVGLVRSTLGSQLELQSYVP